MTKESMMTTERCGFSAQRERKPGLLAAALAIHLGVAEAVMMMPGISFTPGVIWEPIPTTNIPAAKDPPEQEQLKVKPKQPLQKTIDKPDTVTKTDPIVPLAADADVSGHVTPAGGETGTARPLIIVPDPVPPLIIAARPDPRYVDRLQPAYPAAMIRLGKEGSVTVRVSIDEAGRVIAVAQVRADDPAFYDATRRQALRFWRFQPATRDGVAIPATREMTVYFRLDENR